MRPGHHEHRKFLDKKRIIILIIVISAIFLILFGSNQSFRDSISKVFKFEKQRSPPEFPNDIGSPALPAGITQTGGT